MRTANVPTKIQGYIYYAMMNRQYEEKHISRYCLKAIDDVCRDPIDRKMLLEYVSTENSSENVSLKYHTCKRRLHILYKAYVEKVYRYMCSG